MHAGPLRVNFLHPFAACGDASLKSTEFDRLGTPVIAGAKAFSDLQTSDHMLLVYAYEPHI
jgi:hypothetical protein